MRDAGAGRLDRPGGGPGRASASLAGQLVAHLTSPSQAAIRAEMEAQLGRAIDGLDPIDREVLVLRHFEELTNGEVAEVLGLQPKAASIRYVRAVARLKAILGAVPRNSPTRWAECDRAASRTQASRSPWTTAAGDAAVDRTDGARPSAGLDGRRDRDPRRGPGRRVHRPAPAGRDADPRRVRRPMPRAGRGDPRAVPGHRRDGALEAPARPRLAASRPGARPGPRAARRLPPDPRDRPGRHGDRLRGRAGVARPPGRRQGPAAAPAGPTTGRCSGSSARPGPPASLRHGNIVPVFAVGQRGRPALLRHAPDPGGGARPGHPRASRAAGSPRSTARPRPTTTS